MANFNNYISFIGTVNTDKKAESLTGEEIRQLLLNQIESLSNEELKDRVQFQDFDFFELEKDKG